jgi:RHS repeat-associated protein
VESLESRHLLTFTLGADYCPDWEVPFVEPPPCENCGDYSGALGSNGNTGAPMYPMTTSSNPVGYLSGLPTVYSTDLLSLGFGDPLAQSRSWSGTSIPSDAGNGWTQDPYLMVYSVFNPLTGLNDNPIVALVQSGTSATLFSVDGSSLSSGTWDAWYSSQQKISYDSGTDEWTVTDAIGNKIVFNDLPRAGNNLTTLPGPGYPNDGVHGQILRRIDAGGQEVEYDYSTPGQVTILRNDLATGEADRIVRTYGTVSNTLGGSVDLIASAILQRRASTLSAWEDVRTVEYSYYDGEGVDSDHGRLGDLKLVTIRDGGIAGDIIDHEYYRYYKMSGYTINGSIGPTGNSATMGGTDTTYPATYYADNTITSGLKMVVRGESFARMIAEYPSYEGESDADLKKFANNFYAYERWADYQWSYDNYANGDYDQAYHRYTRYRVVSETSQGAGCSSCSNGIGEYRFEFHVNPSEEGYGNEEYDPNIWRHRTIEVLPDNTPLDWGDNDRIVVYTNEYGQVLLRSTVETDDSGDTPSAVSRTGRDVTVTVVGHGYSAGDFISITGTQDSTDQKLRMYDGVYQITSVAGNTFTYQISHIPDKTVAPDPASIRVNAVNHQSMEYFRYREGASGSEQGVGQLVLYASAEAVLGYDEAYDELVGDAAAADYEFLADHSGRIDVFHYGTSTSAGASTPGAVENYLLVTVVKEGELDSGGPLLSGGTIVSLNQYFAHTSGGVTVYPLASQTIYQGVGGAGASTTSYAYTYHGSTLQPKSVEVTLPNVTTAQNGPNTADVVTTVFDTYGRPIWSKDGGGFIHYTEYDLDTGAITKTIKDVSTYLVSNEPSGWTTPFGGGLHLTTQYEFDSLGRTTKVTDPVGNITYTAYRDAEHEVRIYRGWNATTGTTTGPTEIYRQIRNATLGLDNGVVVNEVLKISKAPAKTGSSGSYVPTGAETFTASDIWSLTREITNNGGQIVQVDEYFSLAGVTYSTSQAVLGTASNDSSTGNRHTTLYKYDERGRLERVEDATATVTRTEYDVRGLVTQVWVGTDDTPTSGDWAPDNTAGTNMTMISSNEYDNGESGGSGLLTRTVQYVGSGTDRVQDYYYDNRNRLVATKANENTGVTEGLNDNIRPIFYYQYDNLGRVVAISQYDGDTVILTDGNSDGAVDAPSSSLLRAKQSIAYDNQGRVYESKTHSVNPASGAIATAALVSRTWRDRRGNIIKEERPGQAIEKYRYDGAGHLVMALSTDAGGDTGWTDASDVTGDIVLEATRYTYDDASRIILQETFQRFHDATGTGFLQPNYGLSNPSRSYFTAMFYDAANRLTNVVDVGTFGGAIFSHPGIVPTGDDDTLVTSYYYDAAGYRSATIHPDGRTDVDVKDMLGRTKHSYVGLVDSSPSDGDDNLTEYTYNGVGATRSVTVHLPGSQIQETEYIFGAVLTGGGLIADNRLVVARRSPDKTTGIASTSDQATYSYNRQGELRATTDENNTTHVYFYDALGRLTSDLALGLGTGIDGSVRRISTTYNTQGLVDKITSYGDIGGTTTVNQIAREYNGLGQMTREYQEVSGAVNTSTSLHVDYAFSEMAGGANHSRLTKITYPSGREVDYEYASGVDDAVSRLSGMSDSSGDLEEYSYLGLGTIVEREQTQPGIRQSFIKLTGESVGDAGDKYTGLDRFGRVVDQRWLDNGTNADIDRYQYGYDRIGNRTYRDNVLSAAHGELYDYDELNRLVSFDRGTLNGTHDAIVGTPTRTQAWDLDALGNSKSVTTNGVVQNRTHNAQNELSSVGTATLAYNEAGNQTTDQFGKDTLWDAWGRTVLYTNGGTVNVVYEYDGLGRRIEEGDSQNYYTASWQLIEIHDSGVLREELVWSPVYVDALLMRDRDTNADGIVDERVHALHDANFNITAVTDDAGTVVSRFVYDPYGSRQSLDASFGIIYGDYDQDGHVDANDYQIWKGQFGATVPQGTGADGNGDGVVNLADYNVWNSNLGSGGVIDFEHGFAGGRMDTTSGRIHFRNRDYDPQQMRWNERDPIGFAAGDLSLFRYVGNRPTGFVDPSGLVSAISGNITAVYLHISFGIGVNTGDKAFTYDVSAQGLTDLLLGPVQNHAIDKIKETLLNKLMDMLGKHGEGIFELFDDLTVPLGKKVGAENIMLHSIHITPKYVADYRSICHTGGGNFDTYEGTVEFLGDPLAIWDGQLNFANQHDRGRILSAIRKLFKQIVKNTTLADLQNDARDHFGAAVLEDTDCPGPARVMDLGGIGKPPANLK